MFLYKENLFKQLNKRNVHILIISTIKISVIVIVNSMLDVRILSALYRNYRFTSHHMTIVQNIKRHKHFKRKSVFFINKIFIFFIAYLLEGMFFLCSYEEQETSTNQIQWSADEFEKSLTPVSIYKMILI